MIAIDRRRLLAALAGLVFAAPALADDKIKAPTGTWAKKGGMLRLEFPEKGVIKLHPHGDQEVVVLIGKFTVDKDGIVKVKITDYDGNDDIKKKLKAAVPEGTSFKFKWSVDGEEATIADLEGENVENLRSHLEGKFEAKK